MHVELLDDSFAILSYMTWHTMSPLRIWYWAKTYRHKWSLLLRHNDENGYGKLLRTIIFVPVDLFDDSFIATLATHINTYQWHSRSIVSFAGVILCGVTLWVYFLASANIHEKYFLLRAGTNGVFTCHAKYRHVLCHQTIFRHQGKHPLATLRLRDNGSFIKLNNPRRDPWTIDSLAVC